MDQTQLSGLLDDPWESPNIRVSPDATTSGWRTSLCRPRRSLPTCGGYLNHGLIFDAVRVRLIEIGEAVEDIDPELLATEADVPWRDVIGMRDQLAHRNFDTAHWILEAAIDEDLPALLAAVQRMLILEARRERPDESA